MLENIEREGGVVHEQDMVSASLWMDLGLGKNSKVSVGRVIIVEMENRIKPKGHRKKRKGKERKGKERKGIQMRRPRTCISKVFVPLELDSSTMAVIEGGSVDLRWHSKTD